MDYTLAQVAGYLRAHAEREAARRLERLRDRAVASRAARLEAKDWRDWLKDTDR